jgi:hypothetical protein
MGRYLVRGTALLVVLTIFALPLLAIAQQLAQVRRIAFLGLNFPPAASQPTPFLDEFRQALRDRGWVDRILLANSKVPKFMCPTCLL